MSKANLYRQWERKFNECLEVEFSDPEYFKVHHILVSTYMLQTGAYNKAARKGIVEQLRCFLSDPFKPPSKSDMSVLTHMTERIKAEQGTVRSNEIKMVCTEKSILDVQTNYR